MGQSMSTFKYLKQVLDEQARVSGIALTDVLALPNPLRATLNKMMRGRSLTLTELAADLGVPSDEARQLADIMVAKGLVRARNPRDGGESSYRVRFLRKSKQRVRKMPTDIWKALDD